MDKSKDSLAAETSKSDAQQLSDLLQRTPPLGYLQEWSETLLHPLKEEVYSENQISVIVFRLGDEWLALKSHCFKEVSEERPIHKVPHRSNEVFLGLVNLSGELQLCMDLRSLLGIKGKSEEIPLKSKRLIAIQSESDLCVFPIEEIDGLYLLNPEQIAEVPSTFSHSLKSRYCGIIYLKEMTVGYLDEKVIFQSLRGYL